MAEFSKPTMAPFANITAAELKKGDIIMFAMGSSSPDRVASRADRCLGGQFACACAPISYLMFSTIVDVTNGGRGCCFGDEKGSRKGFTKELIFGSCRVRYFHPQPLTTMVFPT